MYGMGHLLWEQAWKKAYSEPVSDLERGPLGGYLHVQTIQPSSRSLTLRLPKDNPASALYYAEIDRRSRSNEFAMQLIRWYGVGARGVFANLKVTVGPT